MSTFIDRHATTVGDQLRRLVIDSRRKRGVEMHGVRPIDYWIDTGALYCVVDAPDAEAVVRYHADYGVPCDSPHQLDGLRGTHPIPAEDDRRVRSAIQEHWHSGGKPP